MTIACFAGAGVSSCFAINSTEPFGALALTIGTRSTVQTMLRHDLAGINFATGSVETLQTLALASCAAATVEACDVAARVFRAGVDNGPIGTNHTAKAMLRATVSHAGDLRTITIC